MSYYSKGISIKGFELPPETPYFGVRASIFDTQKQATLAI